MFEIKKDIRFTTTEKLLYNIYQLLLNTKTTTNETIQNGVLVEEPLEILKKETTILKKEKEIICKYCGTKYNNLGSMLACSKSCKNKKGVK